MDKEFENLNPIPDNTLDSSEELDHEQRLTEKNSKFTLEEQREIENFCKALLYLTFGF